MFASLIKLMCNEDGATAIEYGLIAALVSIAAVASPESITPDGVLFVRVATSSWMNATASSSNSSAVRCRSADRALWRATANSQVDTSERASYCPAWPTPCSPARGRAACPTRCAAPFGRRGRRHRCPPRPPARFRPAFARWPD